MSEDIKELRKQIEALQQEYDELDTGHSKLFKAYCEMKQEAEQLQAECNAWKQSAEIAEKLALDAQAQNVAMREALRHGVNLADGLYGTGEFVRWAHDDAEPALSSEAGRNYHNPADVAEIEQRGEWIDQQATKILRQQAVLKQAREALDEVNNYSGYEQGFDHDSLLDEVEEAIAAIDKVIGGREDE